MMEGGDRVAEDIDRGVGALPDVLAGGDDEKITDKKEKGGEKIEEEGEEFGEVWGEAGGFGGF